ncbi:hypothetical protein [Spirosoma gilvum]
MLEYLDGAIAEALIKARTLKAKIPGSTLLIDFEALATRANSEIDAAISQLMTLDQDPVYRIPANLKQKILLYRQIVGSLSILENVVVAAIARSHSDDAYVNRLVRGICREIDYPIQKPVASCLSQSYYHIYSGYGLLCMPLLESDFLLHIADIYHELCHPLIQLDNPKLELFQLELGKFNVFVKRHYRDEIAHFTQNTSRKDMIEMLYLWRDCWIEKWSVEFFCDLFGVYTLGPAYAWSNLHLCLKTSTDVYDVPQYVVTSHPPDEARMQVLFHALQLLGYPEDNAQIQEKWTEFKTTMQFTKQAEYDYAVPDLLLEQIAVSAYNAVNLLPCRLAEPGKQGSIAVMLNQAWSIFWQDPAAFTTWEQVTVNSFKASLLSGSS